MAAADDKPVIANLLQLYLHDFSEFEPRELSAHGVFDYAWLDSYFTEPTREAHLITVAARPAGFVLARCDVDGDGGAWNVSEFFVVRGHRGSGVAGQAARLLFQRHPGFWTLSYLPANLPASRFWPKLVAAVADGPVCRFELPAPELPDSFKQPDSSKQPNQPEQPNQPDPSKQPEPKTRLRFRVAPA